MSEMSPNPFDEYMQRERLHRIARHIGGYMGIFVRGMGLQDFKNMLPPESFPSEVWETVSRIQQGALDHKIRLHPYLSFAFPLVYQKSPLIYWQVTARSPEIALYATGDVEYAGAVKNYLRRDQVR